MFVLFLAFVVVLVLCIFYIWVKPSEGSAYEGNTLDYFIRKEPLSNDHGKVQVENTEEIFRCSYNSVGRQILVIFGTEYGFSEEVAKKLYKRLVKKGKSICGIDDDAPLQPRLINAKEYCCIDLEKEELCLIVISTSGDGVPPTDAMEFHQSLMSPEQPELNKLKYSVLALGDSNYPHFCKAGKDIDIRLRTLGAVCMTPRHDVDMEDWSVIDQWMESILDYLDQFGSDLPISMDYIIPPLQEKGFDRHTPFLATLKVKQMLTTPLDHNGKETIHCEFDITDSGLKWTSGDALGIYPKNNPSHVSEIIKLLGYTDEPEIPVPNSAFKPHSGTCSLRFALENFYDLKHVKPDLLQYICQSASSQNHCEFISNLLSNGVSRSNTELFEYLEKREVVDVLEEFHSFVSLHPVKFVECLRSLQPRYYSISSSPFLNADLVCVTAAVLRYTTLSCSREGVLTCHLQDRTSIGQKCPVFISRNPDFRLPENPDLPIILIGPGTGLAPFRAFIQERIVLKQRGEIFLYFGCRRRNEDFLYQDELEKWDASGIINLRVAFSRAQVEKIYVQHLLLEDAKTLWNAITNENAHIYVCGDASQMARDVHDALLSLVQSEGDMDNEQAHLFMSILEKQNRYQKDVWIT